MGVRGQRSFADKIGRRLDELGKTPADFDARQRVAIEQALEGQELTFGHRFRVAHFVGVRHDEINAFLDVDVEHMRSSWAARRARARRLISWNEPVRKRAGLKLKLESVSRGLKPGDLERISARGSRFYMRVAKGESKTLGPYRIYASVLGLDWKAFYDELIEERPEDEDSQVIYVRNLVYSRDKSKDLSRREFVSLLNHYIERDPELTLKSVHQSLEQFISWDVFEGLFDDSVQRPDHRDVAFYRLIARTIGMEYTPELLHDALGWSPTRIRTFYELFRHRPMPYIPVDMERAELERYGLDRHEWTPPRLLVMGLWIARRVSSLLGSERALLDMLEPQGITPVHYWALVEGEPVHLAHLGLVLSALDVSVDEVLEEVEPVGSETDEGFEPSSSSDLQNVPTSVPGTLPFDVAAGTLPLDAEATTIADGPVGVTPLSREILELTSRIDTRIEEGALELDSLRKEFSRLIESGALEVEALRRENEELRNERDFLRRCLERALPKS